jgi:7-cyano-7-deazaguanine synthase
MKNAIILCSGGLDSVTCAFYVKYNLNFNNLSVFFFNYGQRNLRKERTYSKLCSKKIGADFKEIKLDWLGKMSNSLLNNNKNPKHINGQDLKNTSKESDLWYVPCRNLIFISCALAYAENNNSSIFLGFKNDGKETFPDASLEFLNEMNKISKVSVKNSPKIIAPFIDKDKEEIIKIGNELGVDYSKTYSCYVGGKFHCGKCLACRLRKAGFYWSGLDDPTNYH